MSLHWLSSEMGARWLVHLIATLYNQLELTSVDITFWGSSLISSLKAIQHCLMIGRMRPWPQFFWLAVFCVREWLVPEHAPVFCIAGFPISFIYFPGWSSLGSGLRLAFRVVPHFSFSPCSPLHVPKYWILLRSEISWACSIVFLHIYLDSFPMFSSKTKILLEFLFNSSVLPSFHTFVILEFNNLIMPKISVTNFKNLT